LRKKNVGYIIGNEILVKHNSNPREILVADAGFEA